MGLMDRMMERMIKNMSVEEKEEMMLEMMPTTKEDVDINRMMPEMMTTMGDMITLTGIGVLISKALADDELKEELGELLNDLREKMPELAEMMQDMMPVMASLMSDVGLMDAMMHSMGNIMPMMMPMMREMMPTMMMDRMPEVMAEHETVRRIMPEMMIEIMPHCVETMVPTLPPEERSAFLLQLAEKMGRAAGEDGMSTEDRWNLEQAMVGKMRAGSETRPS
jgi:hypothetical protein